MRLAEEPHETRAWIEQGIYPPALEIGAEALEHFRVALLRAG
jgi:hypothetical protein